MGKYQFTLLKGLRFSFDNDNCFLFYASFYDMNQTIVLVEWKECVQDNWAIQSGWCRCWAQSKHEMLFQNTFYFRIVMYLQMKQDIQKTKTKKEKKKKNGKDTKVCNCGGLGAFD